jgi:hypothetical protein
MKRLKINEIPNPLTNDVIEILVEMALEFPKTTDDWANVSELLLERGELMPILFKVQKIQNAEHQKKLAQMTEEEKAIEAEKMKRWNAEKEWRFMGNMGEPETAEEYKYKYGVYPPNYKKE